MKKYLIYIFAALLLFSCGKTELSKEKEKQAEAISAQLSKKLNKFNIAEINTETNFNLFVRKRGKRSAVLFYSNESAPYIQTEIFFNKAAQESSGDILFVKVNLSDRSAKSIGLKNNIFTVPTLVLFNNGEELNRLVGKTNIKRFKSFIQK